MESSIDLQQPVLDGGIRSINFFNGRMLTARDLTREQTANRELTRRLGQAVGDGIAYGLELSKSKSNNSTPEFPLVTVEQGLAVNRQGQTLWLRDKTDVALVRKASANTAGVIFSECRPLQAGTYVAGAGVYLLTVAPAETREGRAVTSALNTGGAACNTDTLVSAVQFRLIQIDPPITSAELANTRLRNLLAYKCFGVSETEGFLSDPLGAEFKSYGLLDGLRPNVLTDCDVPLGVLYWTLNDGIKFIDMWSVRRRVTKRSNAAPWSRLIDDRRASEGEAMFLQFQDEVQELAGEAGETVAAKDHFHYLPAAGVLPMRGSSLPGFDYLQFFDGITVREPVYLEGARVETLIRDSWSYSPVDLDSGEMFWLYWVRQNAQAIITSSTPIQTCLIFSSGQMAFAADPRFDVARWNYSNFV